MRKFIVLLLGLMIALALLAFQDPNDLDEPPGREEGGTLLFANLTGEAEVPGPGDEDGNGRARLRVIPDRGRICFRIRVFDIELPATAAHIHLGTADFAGPIVVNLEAPDNEGRSSGCVSELDPGLVKLIQDNPAVFYVNVHTDDFPAGAVRGQLSTESQN
jgi:hypothetical protein